MQTYSEYQPTGFDRKGAFLRDQGNWLVVPVGRNRDSDILSESNFAAALRELGGESESVEVHRFGHWACGWFEIIIVAPDSTAAEKAEEIESALADYPILDEMDLGERELELAYETWESMSLAERIEVCRDEGVNIFAARCKHVPEPFHWEIIDGDSVRFVNYG